MTPDFVVVKVGGSLFSDKSRPGSLDQQVLRAYAELLAGLVARHPGRLAVVVGGGAFGHGAIRQRRDDDAFGLVALTQACFTVKWAWTEALRAAGVDAFPLQLAAMCTLEQGVPRACPDVLLGLLGRGALPVLSGDCLLTTEGELVSFSSDRVPEVLLPVVPGRMRAVVLTDVPGILRDGRDGGDVLAEVDAHDPGPAYDLLWTQSPWDSTGAMHTKLAALVTCARGGAECFILRGDHTVADLDFLFAPTADLPAGLPRTRIAGVDAAAAA
ncbi:hypothetical protein [Micromonospora cathayae]|uniref:Aspartate/glutamate/uridylate kinase domain-containing protein n=1 Tax=Micromonospora cathayae TaxID=3028804 RepID=A0ABY7ZS21_9ACTN|nr:hypothetical protein [Micromonospora sp. HUAS 3]WDZ85834.1 hypothetical protein PVK37_05210 [Micromonospora sp. HUAS 3]